MMEHVQIDRYASAVILAQISGSPEPICRLMFTIAECPDGVKILRGARQDALIWEQRHAVSWVAREYCGATFPQIGRALNRDHSVIVRGYNRAKLLRRTSPAFRSMCDQLARTLSKREVRRTEARGKRHIVQDRFTAAGRV